MAVRKMVKGPSTPPAGKPLGTASSKRRSSRKTLVVTAAVVLVLVVVAPMLILSYSSLSSISVRVTNTSDETATIKVTKNGVSTMVVSISLAGTRSWDHGYDVSAGTYNITVLYSYPDSGPLKTSKLVKVGIASGELVTFQLVNPKPDVTPAATLAYTNVTDGDKVTITSVDHILPWDDVGVVLVHSRYMGTWLPNSAVLSGSGPVVQHLGSRTMGGSTTIWCNVTDIAGNGRMDVGDNLTFCWSSMYPPMPSIALVLELFYLPNGELIATISMTP